MNSKTKYTILLVSSVVVVYAIVGGMMGRVSAQNGAYQQLSILMEVIQRIQNDYVDDPSMESAWEGAIRGMVERVDPYGGYLSPENATFYREYDPRKPAGVGVTLAKKFDYPVIVSAVPGGPADRAGLGTGDTIEGIGGESLREHNLVEVQRLLSGEAGTTIELNVIRRRRPAPEVLTLTREVVQVPPVEARLLDGRVAYIRVPLLASGKALEAKRQLETLTRRGATHVVLDLRNSAGGTLQEAVELANLFVESGTLGYVDGQTVDRETFTAKPGNAVSKLPLVVLINEGTADAAEVAAAAIRDNDRGQLIGTRTFGLGSVQRLLPLDGGRALLLSVAKYYSPAGEEIQKEGVAPTEEVAASIVDPLAAPSESEAERDLQLDRALEILLEPAEAAAPAA